MAETLNSKNKQPSVWKNCRVEDFCTTASGGTPLTTRRDYYDDGHIPWLRSGEVSQGRVRHAEISITQAGLDNSSAKLFKKGTILVAMYGATAGEVGILEFESSTNQAVCGITPGPSVDGEFLFQALLLRKPALIKMAGGGAQPNISQEIIRNFKIPLPPLAEQRKIAEILRTWDEAVETAEAELKAKQERKRGLTKKLLMPSAEGDGVLSSKKNKARYSPLGALVIKIEGGGTPSKEVPGFWDGDIPLLTIKDLPNARLGLTVDRITTSGLESSSSKIVPAGIPVIATRMDVGKVVRCPVPVAINQDLRAIYPDPDKVDVDYIVQVLPTLEREFLRYSCGSTVMGIGIDDLKSVKIYLPPLAEQRKIAEILQGADSDIETINHRIESLRTQKRGLMQKLLTGEVRVAA
jgi:type I restriction enzyme S subunit